MTRSFQIEDFGIPPPPPKILYKYLSPDRIGNVLGCGTVRFTPLMNTNDSFEVRSTFHKLAGPRFIQMLDEQIEHQVSKESIDAAIADALKEIGLGGLNIDFAKQHLERIYGRDISNVLRSMMKSTVDKIMVPCLNDPNRAEELLDKLGRRLMCFSLSERYDSPPMWAHYAANDTGFVVAFDTEHDWFQHRKDAQNTRLQKITYFDGKVEEPLENIQAAFISKTADWSYEREWRIYANEDEIEKTVGTPDDPVHLLTFPADAVARVIVGSKATEETVKHIRAVLGERYPGVELLRAFPDRSSQTYKLEQI